MSEGGRGRTAENAPLNGVRVLDFSGTMPGPLATEVLVQLGADVIKVERPGFGDPARQFSMFMPLNAGKRSIALDLKNESGAVAARQLVATSDIVVEGFRPGVMDRLGLGYEDCLVHNPTVVYCSLSGFGQTGPRQTEPGHDITYTALAGLAGLRRNIDGSLVLAGPPMPGSDVIGGLFAAIAIVAALRRVAEDGTGVFLDVPLADAALVSAIVDIARPVGDRIDPMVTEHSGMPTYRLFETSDGRAVALGIMPEEQYFWDNFCEAIDHLEWQGGTEAQRRNPELGEDLTAMFGAEPLETWVGMLSGSDVPWAPVATIEEARLDPQFQHRGLFDARSLNFPVGVRGLTRSEAPVSPGIDTAGVLEEAGVAPEIIRSVLEGALAVE